jgi:hypothetical protein
MTDVDGVLDNRAIDLDHRRRTPAEMIAASKSPAA